MSNVAFSRIASFSPVLVAVVHKGTAPALTADAIATAAEQYCLNGGAKNKIDSVTHACVTTEKGGKKTAAKGTSAALILESMNDILARAVGIGARPGSFPELEKDEAHKARAELAEGFALTIRAEYLTRVQASADARKAVRDAAKPAATVKTGDATSGDAFNGFTAPPVASEALASLGVLSAQAQSEFTAACDACPAQFAALRSLIDAHSAIQASKNAALQDSLRTAEIAALMAEADSIAPAAETAKRNKRETVAA